MRISLSIGLEEFTVTDLIIGRRGRLHLFEAIFLGHPGRSYLHAEEFSKAMGADSPLLLQGLKGLRIGSDLASRTYSRASPLFFWFSLANSMSWLEVISTHL